jgi:DNA modification methylase
MAPRAPTTKSLSTFARSISDRVEFIPISQLKPFARRTRTHSEEQISLIMGSFQAFGVINPLIIDEAGQVLAGHARWEAAKRLDIAELPAVRVDHLSDDEKRAYVIADNRIAETAGWDRGALAIEFAHLTSIDLGFEIDTLGFSTTEIDLIIGEAEEDTPEPEDEVPALPQQSVTALGDVWLLGKHKLLCGSALEGADFAALMGVDKARMALTDPPYNVPIDGFVGGLGKVKHREFAMAAGEMSEDEFSNFLFKAISNMAQHLIDGGLLYSFMDFRHVRELLEAGRAAGLSLHNFAVWDKMSGGMGSHYRGQHELCPIFKNGKAPHLNTVELGKHGRYRTNVWSHRGMSSFGAGRDEALASHPTVKPVGLLVEAIKDCTRRGDLVIDPFLGSGSTLIAAEKAGRVCYGIELDPLYCDLIIARYEKLTGNQATNAATGLTHLQTKQRATLTAAAADAELEVSHV